MKKKITALNLAVLLLLVAHFFSFTNNPAAEALQKATTKFHDDLIALEDAIGIYKTKAVALQDDPKSLEALQTAHINTRLAFKKAEPFLEHFDHSAVKRWLNGAPLPSVEPKVAEVLPLEPKGLQVLDELVFSEDPLAEKETILDLVNTLEWEYRKIKNYQSGIKVTHRNVFEATRQELVRIFTLGVTGFDTPSSGNALPEATVAMNSLAKTVEPYYPLLQEKNNHLYLNVQKQFEAAIAYLENNQDFDTFDRLTFLKEHINPLYELTYKMHRALGIETIDEVSDQPQAVNYHATNIFETEFLNPSFYANRNLSQPIFEKRVALGRLLFFDPILSKSNQRSCASCHNPDKGFTDGLRKSLTTNSKGQGHVKRNSPTILNSVFSERYFYDMREEKLEKQIMHVVLDTLEFGTDFATIIDKLKQSETYKTLFAEAYANQPNYTLTQWSLSDALAAYVSSLSSFDSPFDQYVRGERAEIDPAVQRGFNLFMGKAVCGTCHFAPTFNGTVPPLYDESESEILGVPATKDTLNPVVDPDWGRAASGRPIDRAPFYIHSFKTTTVRNAALTAPYMHNGVYDTLEEVVDFYNKGGGQGLGIELEYQTLPFDNLNLTEQEMADLVAFMEALTDNPGKDHEPEKLPAFEKHPEWNARKVGGVY